MAKTQTIELPEVIDGLSENPTAQEVSRHQVFTLLTLLDGRLENRFADAIDKLYGAWMKLDREKRADFYSWFASMAEPRISRIEYLIDYGKVTTLPRNGLAGKFFESLELAGQTVRDAMRIMLGLSASVGKRMSEYRQHRGKNAKGMVYTDDMLLAHVEPANEDIES